MAKIVIAGHADCPYYAKVELLADKLSRNLNDFKLHKIVKTKEEWQDWLNQTCKDNNWTHTKSPLVWRELIARGGKAVLIGGGNEFQEYAKGYYGDVSELKSDDMLKIADENLKTKIELDNEERERQAKIKPVHICITNATNPVAYNLIPSFANGDILGPNLEVSLHLLDTPENAVSLDGVRMEAEDMSHNLLRKVTASTDPTEVFSQCSCIVFLDELQFEPDTEKSQQLLKYHELYTTYAEIIKEHCDKNVKILVANSGPVNLIIDTITRIATNINTCNVIGLSRLLENRVKAVLADRLKVNSAYIADVVVWGNGTGNKFVDINNSRVYNYDGAVWGPPFYSVPALEKIYDKKWLESEFLQTVDQRGENLKTALQHNVAFSHASAVSTLLSHWFQGCRKGEVFSLVVKSEGWYQVPENVVFSMPVTFFPPGYWSIVEDIDMPEESTQKLQECVKDIQSELDVIYAPPAPTTDSEQTQTEASDVPVSENSVLSGSETQADGLSKILEQDENNSNSNKESSDESGTVEQSEVVAEETADGGDVDGDKADETVADPAVVAEEAEDKQEAEEITEINTDGQEPDQLPENAE